MTTNRLPASLALMCCLAAAPAEAQIVEAVGNRALGMGGAFVAVADDSTATWWNPAALAAGPFVDVSVGWNRGDTGVGIPGGRLENRWVSLTTPPFGLSYYRLQSTDIGQFHTIGPDDAGREDRRAAVPVWSLSASQVGATLVHTVISGVHVGTTLKYVWANGLGTELSEPEPVSRAQAFRDVGQLSGETARNFDLDVGVLAVAGPVRMGGVVRNVRETELTSVKLPRQVRLGVAVAIPAGSAPLTLALDGDAASYPTPLGERRVVAVGGEGWVWNRRLGLRAGARFNTVGAEERAATVGLSLAVRTGMYLEAFAARGGTQDERGWGVAARASF